MYYKAFAALNDGLLRHHSDSVKTSAAAAKSAAAAASSVESFHCGILDASDLRGPSISSRGKPEDFSRDGASISSTFLVNV